MRVALFADIHANRPAFSACLAHARAAGAEQIVLLGDYVGYGADPDWTVTTVMELVDHGALAVRGNHDSAVGDASVRLNLEASIAMEWTRGELDVGQRRFLAGLPLTIVQDDRLYVHSEASRPGNWTYVMDSAAAAGSMIATPAHLTFCGHVHKPALYSMSSAGKLTSFTPTTGIPIQLLPGRHWLAVMGSVGQPRDRSPAAAYAMLETTKAELTYCRVPYDVEEAAQRIRARGLPELLAERLFVGR